MIRSAARIKDCQFAVIDVETTGLFPRTHDRIIEIAVVTITGCGEIVEEYASLLNPGRDLGPVDIHGIRGSDVVSAPRFEDVAGDLADRLSGSVVAGHNLRFDLDFVTAESLGDSFATILKVFAALERNRIYLNLNPKCEPQLGPRGLYSGSKDAPAPRYWAVVSTGRATRPLNGLGTPVQPEDEIAIFPPVAGGRQ